MPVSGVLKKTQPLQPIAMLLHHRFEHLRVPSVSGLQAIKGAMYQGHEFRIAPRPAEKKKTPVFFVDRSFFCGGKKIPRRIFLGGAGVICGGDRTETKVVVLKMVPSILEGRCWNRRLGGVLTILDWYCTNFCIIELRKVTVDGSEIRRSPVEVGNLSRYFQSFFTSQVVVWDFSHQQ